MNENEIMEQTNETVNDVKEVKETGNDSYGRAKVERLRSDNGYIIRFPSPMPLDREYD